MLEQKEYVAIQDFSLNLDNGKTTINVKVGDYLTFDGLNVSFKEEKGSARALSKVIGEWIALADRKVNAPSPTLVSGSRNATAGKIVEHSDIPSDPTVATHQRQPSDDLETLIRQSEQPQETKIVEGKREVTSDMDDIKKEIKVTNNDGNIVRKVTVSEEEAPVVNKESVDAKDPDAGRKPAVLSIEGSVAKKTNYSGTEDQEEEGHKKLELDYESSGVTYKETSYEGESEKKVQKGTFKDHQSVSKVSASKVKSMDVGSSTQAGVEATKTESPTNKKSSKKDIKTKTTKKKASTTKKSSLKKNTKKDKTEESVITDDISDIDMGDIIEGPTEPEVTVTEIPQTIDNVQETVISDEPSKKKKIVYEGQEATVISKIKDESVKTVTIENGITSKVTVGAESSSGIEMGDVEFSSNSDIDVPEVSFSGNEDTASDIIGDDIDVNDILKSI